MTISSGERVGCSTNSRVWGTVADFFGPHVEVSLGKTWSPELLWMDAIGVCFGFEVQCVHFQRVYLNLGLYHLIKSSIRINTELLALTLVTKLL